MDNNISISPILIIGGAGFVGNHLLQECAYQNIITYSTKLPNEEINIECNGVYDLNLLDTIAIRDILNKVKPNAIINLSAQSSVAKSWDNPALTIDVNIKGAVNLLEAVKKYKADTKILMISSSEEYGRQVGKKCVISEDQVINPANPYAVTKATQTLFSNLYNDAYGMNIITMRAFNHIGPGQSTGFVVPDFCQQIVNIEQGKSEAVIKVGNLDVYRDFTDVRDIVKGYISVIKNGKRNSIYNIGSGKSVKIKTILEILLSMSKVSIEVVTDLEKFRPIDVESIEASIHKIQRDTGYKPAISLEESLYDTLEYFRKISERE